MPTIEERLAVLELLSKQSQENGEKLDNLLLQIANRKGFAIGILATVSALSSLVTFFLTYFKGFLFGHG